MVKLGRILHVNLTDNKIWTEPISADLAKKFLGGRGINAKLLWDNMKTGIDAFDPANVLVFGAGTLSGTIAPSSGRATVTCKGPSTNAYLKTSPGGQIAAELKFADYGHLVVYGASEKPVYLWIKDDNVEIRHAVHIWGKDVRETDKIIKEEIGDDDAKIACIGPSGEKRVRFAAVMVSTYHAAGRGGAGAVMGSKNLKAIALRGTQEVEIAEPEVFYDVAVKTRKELMKDAAAQGLQVYGTSGFLEGVNAAYALPTRNFQRGRVSDEHAHNLSGQNLVEKGYLKRTVGCFSCGISCHRYTTVDSGKYAGSFAAGPEYETLSSFGAGCDINDTEAVLKANELCNIYGLDTISTGSVVGWAMECYEKGLIKEKDADGLKLNWGNGDACNVLIKKIAYREGIGDLLAEGVKRAAQEVGGDSWKWAVHSKGLEQSRVETRTTKGYALAFAVNPRGADHLHTEPIAEFGLTPEAKALIKKITGDEKYAVPFITEKRAEIVLWHEDCYAVTDALGFCAFTSTAAYGVTPENMAQMFSAATGIKMDEEEIMKAGERMLTLEKCFNIREGLDRKDDVLPWRLMNEPAPEGPLKGYRNSPEELNMMLDLYYALHEWDKETSWPTKKRLKALELEDAIEELDKSGRKLKD